MNNDNISARIGDAQGKMMIAKIRGNKELEEHYMGIAISLVKELREKHLNPNGCSQ